MTSAGRGVVALMKWINSHLLTTKRAVLLVLVKKKVICTKCIRFSIPRDLSKFHAPNLKETVWRRSLPVPA